MRTAAAQTTIAPALYLTEAEIALRVGMSQPDWEAAARVLERGGLPKGDPVFKGRRYWPAVRAYLDRRNGLTAQSRVGRGGTALGPDGEESWA